jgi:4-hydroxymandelate oxidase
MNPDRIVSLTELEDLAKDHMSPVAMAYVSGGAADEITMRANSEEWRRIRLNPRVLVDVSTVDLKTEILGQAFDLPILLAPAAFHGLCHRDAEIATLKGANAAGVTLVTSSYSNHSVEALAAAAKRPLWFQLYTQADKEMTRKLVERAQAAGCKAICVTVDTPVLGARLREARSSFRLPSHLGLPNLGLSPAQVGRAAGFSAMLNPALTWKDVEWLRSIAKVPVLLKGVLNPEDALRAVDAGVAGVIVSNHGGRNLDTLPSTAEALPRIADKVQGKLLLLVDGGIRRGTDVLKALAMGARAVLVGRPYLFGLAVAGPAGVERVVGILRNELSMAMALTGRRSIAEIDGSVLWQR